MEAFLFYVFAIVAIVSASLMISFRHPVYSALSLVTTLFCVAGLFILLSAHFIAAVQILVYAGAIMVLFLFVIMLLNVRRIEEPRMRSRVGMGLGAVLVGVFLVEVVSGIGQGVTYGRPGNYPVTEVERVGNTEVVGKLLYTEYIFPFEVASLILLVALLGAVVLAKRRTQ
ncbi:MAG: NADH-quinone oxidoreductase subunit J [Candidatus Latescibacteria bacterium]|nr:NADH-quinone oxidoreductase subunit J [Candidatus Latescibacterota bacterium]